MRYLEGGRVILIVSLLAGCQQMPRHTNTLMFATDTKGGLHIGIDQNQIPQIMIGYNRQEWIFLPLVANTGGPANELKPCPQVTGSTPGTPISDLPANCLLKGKVNGTDGFEDSYSVIATFKGAGSAKVESQNATASGSVAQYIATGIAARILADRAGGSAVATGTAAEKSAERAQIEELLESDAVLASYHDKSRRIQESRAAVLVHFEKIDQENFQNRLSELAIKAKLTEKYFEQMGITDLDSLQTAVNDGDLDANIHSLAEAIQPTPKG